MTKPLTNNQANFIIQYNYCCKDIYSNRVIVSAENEYGKGTSLTI